MKNIIIIGTYPKTDRDKSELLDLVRSLKKSGNAIMVVAHLNIPTEVLDEVDYYIYDKDNRILPKEKSPVTWYADNEDYINTWVCRHHYCIMKNLVNALSVASSNGYSKFLYMESDIIFSHDDIENINTLFSDMERDAKKLVFKISDNEETFGRVNTTVYAANVEYFMNNIPLTKEYEQCYTLYPYSIGDLLMEDAWTMVINTLPDADKRMESDLYKKIFPKTIIGTKSLGELDHSISHPVIYNLSNPYLPLFFTISKGGTYRVLIDGIEIVNGYYPSGAWIKHKFEIKPNTDTILEVYVNNNFVIKKIINEKTLQDSRDFAEMSSFK